MLHRVLPWLWRLADEEVRPYEPTRSQQQQLLEALECCPVAEDLQVWWLVRWMLWLRSLMCMLLLVGSTCLTCNLRLSRPLNRTKGCVSWGSFADALCPCAAILQAQEKVCLLFDTLKAVWTVQCSR